MQVISLIALIKPLGGPVDYTFTRVRMCMSVEMGRGITNSTAHVSHTPGVIPVTSSRTREGGE